MDRTSTTLALISHSGAAVGACSYGGEAITGTLAGYGFSVGSSGYDTEDRLVNWQRSDSALSQLWNLSLVGDWNSITENSAVQTRTHGDAHEPLTAGGSAVSHDTKGQPDADSGDACQFGAGAQLGLREQALDGGRRK